MALFFKAISRSTSKTLLHLSRRCLSSTARPRCKPTISKTVTAATAVAITANKGVEGGGATSSISESLIETLPGWRVDDFLDSSSPPSFGIYKTVVDEVMPFCYADLESNLGSFSSPNNVGIWVPQAPPPQYPHQYSSPNTSLLSDNKLPASFSSLSIYIQLYIYI
ncbi:B-box zinc finger protein 21-like [Camellia sinensis]|uniref:B-box zinc finger protein 21-like n=1 Tax=Camellia sinensis TaxID=4442 RepID=UPI001036C681|nr:B-box zinc finger protein 21-like [Camellia sinensis]